MLIFDSGVGGLSLLSDIKKELPKIHYIYVLDNEAFPYGEKQERFIIQRSMKIIKKIKNFYPIKVIVIACNTVSTISLPILKNTFNIPIIGIRPSLKKAVNATKNQNIGFIATKATTNSAYIKEIIKKYSLKNKIHIIATNKLANIAENKTRRLSFSLEIIKNIFKPWTTLLYPPDTIILGCTHFLHLKKEIQHVFGNQLIYFINSYEEIIAELKKIFYLTIDHQKIKKNIFLYSQKNIQLEQLSLVLKRYEFHEIKKINLT